ncbi:hypothetical protein D3C72_2399480 [compost metagenome]
MFLPESRSPIFVCVCGGSVLALPVSAYSLLLSPEAGALLLGWNGGCMVLTA